MCCGAWAAGARVGAGAIETASTGAPPIKGFDDWFCAGRQRLGATELKCRRFLLTRMRGEVASYALEQASVNPQPPNWHRSVR
jgi:hypothetical protein